MAKHRRYSRRKSQRRNRRNRRYSLKMRGGVDTQSILNDSQNSLPGQGLNMSDLNVTGQSQISNQSQPGEGFQNWENPDYSGNTSFESYQSDNNESQSFDSIPSLSEAESIATDEEPFDGDISMIEEDENGSVVGDMDVDQDVSFGGKRRRSNKRKTKKSKKTKKTKKSKKTKTHRKRSQRGGQTMTSEDMNPNDNRDTENMLTRQLRMVS